MNQDTNANIENHQELTRVMGLPVSNKYEEQSISVN